MSHWQSLVCLLVAAPSPWLVAPRARPSESGRRWAPANVIILSRSNVFECGRSALYNSRNAIWAPSHVTIILPAPPPARTHVLADHGPCSHLVLSHYKPLPPFWPPDITPALTTTMFELAPPTAFGDPHHPRNAIFLGSSDEPSYSYQLQSKRSASSN
jgi:hypothetical protein